MKIKQCIIACLIVCFIPLSGCRGIGDMPLWGELFSRTSSGIDVYTLDIGQGDAHVIRQGPYTILVDAGDVDHRENMVGQLKKMGIRHIHAIIVSHAHADHMGGVYGVVQAIPVDCVYDTGIGSPQSVFRTYEKVLRDKHIPRKTLRSGDVLRWGDALTFRVYGPCTPYIYKKGHVDLNENSVVGKLEYKRFSMLFTGDAGKEEERVLIKKYSTKLSSQILKVGHHGSNGSSSLDFIRSVRPEAAIISCGLHNRYGHPGSWALRGIASQHVVDRKTGQKRPIDIYRTDTQGRIHIHSEGKGYTVHVER